MSQLKFATNLFLGKAEMNRLTSFIDTNGWRLFFKNSMLTPGIVKNPYFDLSFQNGQVTIQDLVDFIIKVQTLQAVDSNGNKIALNNPISITIPVQNTWYWVKIAYATTNVEQGTFAIDTQGNITGTGSQLSTVLRGMPNFKSRVKFVNAILNTQEYDVIQVTSDSQAILLGTNFQAESGLQMAVVGTFSPGITVPDQDKFSFVYDSSIISLVPEVAANVAPAKINGLEFYLARVQARIDSGSTFVVEIQDKRKEILNYIDAFNLMSLIQNEIVGCEQIKFQNDFTDKSKNDVRMGWSLRTNTWSVNDTLNQIFLSNGIGGSIKALTAVQPNQFVGWRLYSPKGKYSTIISCIQASGGLKVNVDTLDIDDFSPDGGATTYAEYITITPDAEEIEFKFTNQASGSIDEYHFLFPINEKFGVCDVTVNDPATTQFLVQYRYKNVNEYTLFKNIADDAINGYYNENQFNYTAGGMIANPTFTAYQNGLLSLLTANSGSFSIAIIALLTGFKEPLLLSGFDITPGVNTVTISAGVAFINGNIVKTIQYVGGFPVYLSSSGNYSTVQPGGTFVTFDPFTSQAFDDVAKRHTTKPFELIELEQYDSTSFDNSGRGKWKYLGFALSNGANGTIDRTKYFSMGFDPNDTDGQFNLGDSGGSLTHVLLKNELPASGVSYKDTFLASADNTVAGLSAYPNQDDAPADNNGTFRGVTSMGTCQANNAKLIFRSLNTSNLGTATPFSITPPYKPVVILMRLPN